MMAKLNKLLIIGALILVIVCSALSVCAAGSSDYVALEYATVTNTGTNQISIAGKGIFAVKIGSDVDSANAVIFKDTVDPRNFKAVLKFDKDYANGEGYNQGWYSVNFSESPNWFSSVKSVIKQNDISGLNVTLKLDTMNKKRVFIQPSRYSPAAGFKYLMNGTWIDIDKDWECTFSIQDGKLYLDDNFVTDLSDALSIALPDNKAFVGFGGFSESFYDVGMTVTYDGTVVRNDYDNYGKVTTPETEPPVNTNPTIATAAPTEPPVATVAPTQPTTATVAPTEPPVATVAPTEPPVATAAPTEPPVATVSPSEPVTDPATTTPATTQTNPPATEKPDVPEETRPETNQGNDVADEYIEVDITGYVIAGVAIILVVAGVITLLVIKKKKKA